MGQTILVGSDTTSSIIGAVFHTTDSIPTPIGGFPICDEVEPNVEQADMNGSMTF